MKLSNIASTVIATLALVAGAAHAEESSHAGNRKWRYRAF